MKNQKSKIICAWIMLVISVILALALTYFKFFLVVNDKIEEKPINESSSKAIHIALNDIITNFNQNPKIKKYADENNITLIASVNNYSIFISYITNTTTTYEFSYDDLCLNIIINDVEEDIQKFNIVYGILIEAVQKRINNTNDIENIINKFLNEDVNYEGLTKFEIENRIKYQIDITKKIK